MMRIPRRTFIGSAATAPAMQWSRSSSAQARTDAGRSSDLITAETQRAIDRGLTWLSKRQVLSGRNEGAFGHGGYPGGVAVGSLAGLAFMCSGSPPGQGPFGKHIDRCIKFIGSCVQDGGYISLSEGGQDNMYGHGIATLFLAEVYGMSERADVDRTVGEKLRKAVKLTCECQN